MRFMKGMLDQRLCPSRAYYCGPLTWSGLLMRPTISSWDTNRLSNLLFDPDRPTISFFFMCWPGSKRSPWRSSLKLAICRWIAKEIPDVERQRFRSSSSSGGCSFSFVWPPQIEDHWKTLSVRNHMPTCITFTFKHLLADELAHQCPANVWKKRKWACVGIHLESRNFFSFTNGLLLYERWKRKKKFHNDSKCP